VAELATLVAELATLVAELATQVADAHTVVAAVYTRWPAVVAVASTVVAVVVASTVAVVAADTAVVVVDTGKRALAEERFTGNGWRLCQPFFFAFRFPFAFEGGKRNRRSLRCAPVGMTNFLPGKYNLREQGLSDP
jgi:hypothetical protein